MLTNSYVSLLTRAKKYVKIRFMSEIKVLIKGWVRKVGADVATGRLIARGMSARAAERLCDGTYPYEPKSLRTILLDEMSKDGITLASEAS